MNWKSIRSTTVIFVCFVLPANSLAISSVPSGKAFAASSAAAADEIEIFDRVNRERERFRLQDLDWDEDAARLARIYSARMAREGFFDHIDPDGNSIVERAERIRLRNWSMIGENLFMSTAYSGYATLAVSGWMKSSTHRQNMLDRRWTATGIGVAKDRNGQIYVTQVFLER